MRLLIWLIIYCTPWSFFAQDTLSRPVRSTAWQWNFGIGYRQTDLTGLSDRLFPGALTRFDNAYFTGSAGVNVVIQDRFMLGIEGSSMLVPSIMSRNNFDYYLSGGHGALNVGVLILNGRKVNLAFSYGFGADVNALLIQETGYKASGFEDAISRPLTSTITSFNSTHSFALKFRFLGNVHEKRVRFIQHGWGFDLGYVVAGTNQWTDFNQNKISGPPIDNSGIFFRVAYQLHRQKFQSETSL